MMQQHNIPPFSAGMNRLVDPLSPILTDQEMSPLHHDLGQPTQQQKKSQRRSDKNVARPDGYRDNTDFGDDANRSEEDEVRIIPDFLTSDDNLSSRSTSAPVSPSATSNDYHSDENARADRRDGRICDERLDDEDDLVTSQATQGYSEGLADNELDLSEMDQPSSMLDHPENIRINPAMSPLEYSAMLKLYSESGGVEQRVEDLGGRNDKNFEVRSGKGPITRRESNELRSQVGPMSAPGPWAGTKSTAKDLISRFQNSSNASSLQPSQPGGYHRVSTKDEDIDKSDGELEALGQPASLFSSSSESENEGEKDRNKGAGKDHVRKEENVKNIAGSREIQSYRQRASQLPMNKSDNAGRDPSPEFRWDGSRIEKQTRPANHLQNKAPVQQTLTNGETVDEEISEDQESCFTEDGMEDLYDDESYLDDEDENGLADVETDYDEDKYNDKLQQKMKQMQQKQGSNDLGEPRKTNENISTEPPTNITKAANLFPPKTVTSILSAIKGNDGPSQMKSKTNESAPSDLNKGGQTNATKKSSIPRPVTSANSFSSKDKIVSNVGVARTASNASTSKYQSVLTTRVAPGNDYRK